MIRSTPLPLVSTSVTFGRLKVSQVLVVEARPLAELAVPGLQRLGGGRVLDDRVDARADLLHLLKSASSISSAALFASSVAGSRLARRRRQQVADDVGPAVADQVLVLDGRRRRGR